MASWGEFGPSLEDMAMLTSLSLFNKAHAMGVTLDGEDRKRQDFLKRSLSKSRYETYKATYLSGKVF